MVPAVLYRCQANTNLKDAFDGLPAKAFNEIFIASKSIAFNERGHILTTEAPRNGTSLVRMIQLPEELVNRIVGLANATLLPHQPQVDVVNEKKELDKKLEGFWRNISLELQREQNIQNELPDATCLGRVKKVASCIGCTILVVLGLFCVRIVM